MTTSQILRDQAEAQLPEHMINLVMRYINTGVRSGTFVEMIASHNLEGIEAQTDIETKDRVQDFVDFFNDHAPPECHGSHEIVLAWRAKGGLDNVPPAGAPKAKPTPAPVTGAIGEGTIPGHEDPEEG